MNKTKILLSAVLCFYSIMCYCQSDTIYNRYKHYYYTTWYDSCYAAGKDSDYAETKLFWLGFRTSDCPTVTTSPLSEPTSEISVI